MKKTKIFILVLSILFTFVGCKNAVKDNIDTSSQQAVSSDSEQIISKPETGINSETNMQSTVSSNDEQILSKPENDTSSIVNTQSTVSTIARPEKVTIIYNTKLDFEVNTPQKETFYDPQNGNSLPYTLYIPKNYSTSNKYPVILFLHGAGEIGSDNQTQINGMRNMLYYNADFVSQAILICPQSNEWWNLDRKSTGDQKGTLGSALHLLEKIQQTYSCDSNRIYVTGLSMGGYATWDLLEQYGDIFAAGIPLCGGGNSDNGTAFKDIPIRIYHGTNDMTVSISNSQRMYNSIIAAGGKKVEFYPLDGYGHDVWSYAYKNRDLFSWMFAQSKVNNPTGKYDYINNFRIVDSNGTTVITNEDVISVDYSNDFDENNSVNINITLTKDAQNSLNKAYTESNGSAFTVYCYSQKIYSFTADKPITDDVFSIVGVFNEENYFSFLEIVQNVKS